jgi:hypothetical protein
VAHVSEDPVGCKNRVLYEIPTGNLQIKTIVHSVSTSNRLAHNALLIIRDSGFLVTETAVA